MHGGEQREELQQVAERATNLSCRRLAVISLGVLACLLAPQLPVVDFLALGYSSHAPNQVDSGFIVQAPKYPIQVVCAFARHLHKAGDRPHQN